MTETATVETTKMTKIDGTIEAAHGRPLTELKFKDGFQRVDSIDYVTEYEHVLRLESVPKDEYPSDADLLKLVNDKRKANARQKQIARSLDEFGVIKPTLETDDEFRIAQTMKGMLAARKKDGTPLYTEDEARALAKSVLGLD